MKVKLILIKSKLRSLLTDLAVCIPGLFILIYSNTIHEDAIIILFFFMVLLHTSISILITKRGTIGSLSTGLELKYFGNKINISLVLLRNFYVIFILCLYIYTYNNLFHNLLLTILSINIFYPWILKDDNYYSILDLGTKSYYFLNV